MLPLRGTSLLTPGRALKVARRLLRQYYRRPLHTAHPLAMLLSEVLLYKQYTDACL